MMKNRVSFAIITLLVLAIVIPSAGIVAQEPEPGEGGTIFLAGLSGDPRNLVPFMGTDGDSSSIYGLLYPGVFGVDWETGLVELGVPQSLATGYSYDETGKVLTITLREDAFWSDGEQITTADVIWALDALRSGLLDTPRSLEFFTALDDGTPGSGILEDYAALDDFTLELTFSRADCSSLTEWPDYVIPSHIFEADFGDDIAALNDEPLYDPGVYFGAFVAPDIVAGDRVSLIANQEYSDTVLGYVSPGEYVDMIITDGDVALERFRAGDITIHGIPGADQEEFENDPNFMTYRFPYRGYTWIGFNLANPENPQPAYDDDGNYVEVDPHPVLADKRVRQAMSLAINFDAIIENTLGGNAVRIGTNQIPASWAYDPDLMYPFDPVAAMDLLEEAGWVLDGEYRVCQGCTSAEDGTPMQLVFSVPEGGTDLQEQRYEFIIQSWRDIGIDVELEYLEWGSAFIPKLLGQEFDLVTLNWSVSLPIDPDATTMFGTENDVPGAGYNTGSYHNEELDQLYIDGRNPALTDGCTVEGRLPYYQRANEILFDELPYIFMYNPQNLTAAQGGLQNWEPKLFSRTDGMDAWVMPQN